ncbi:hypothetical protein ACX8XN_09840 [Calditrichota bacterium GD2]
MGRKSLYILWTLTLLTGCAPGPPPPPPLPGFEWLIFGLAIFLCFTVWKKYSPKETQKTNYLTDALNAINRKLEELEKKMDELEKKQNPEK